MWKNAGRAPSLRVFTLAFALQLRKKYGKTTVRVRETSARLIKTSVRVQYTYYKDTHTLQNRHKHTHYSTIWCILYFQPTTKLCSTSNKMVKRVHNRQGKEIQFLPYGKSIGSWICLTHKTYTCHTVQNTYSASMAVSDSQSIFCFNLSCLSYSALFRFLSRMRCTSMGVWGSMIY
jgi:hypothetical protein